LPGRPTTSRRFFRSAEPIDPGLPSAPFSRRERAERQLFPDHHQRLRRPIEVIELTVSSAREELIASDEERQRPTVTNRFVEPHAEHVAQRRKQPPQPRHGEAAVAKVGKHLEFEHIERRVSPFRKTARFGSLRSDRG
jgi:hypothetical protein